MTDSAVADSRYSPAEVAAARQAAHEAEQAALQAFGCLQPGGPSTAAADGVPAPPVAPPAGIVAAEPGAAPGEPEHRCAGAPEPAPPLPPESTWSAVPADAPPPPEPSDYEYEVQGGQRAGQELHRGQDEARARSRISGLLDRCYRWPPSGPA